MTLSNLKLIHCVACHNQNAACAKARAWKDALKLLDDMKERNVLPNEYTYSSTITACGNCGQWKQSLELLDQVRKIVQMI